MLNCIDNSGATIVECVANLRMKRHGRVGEECLQLIRMVNILMRLRRSYHSCRTEVPFNG